MSARHFDVVVLGRSLGALSAAALLARRDFRVLLLGQGESPASYRYERRWLKRRAFTWLAGSSPAWRRLLHELAQTQTFRRRTRPLDPMFVVMSEGRRMEIPPDPELFAREIDRELPEVRQLVDEMYATFGEVNAAADAAFDRDVVWPPGNLWERIETGRVAAALPFTGVDETEDLLGKFPAGHPYREIAVVPALFGANLAAQGPELPAFALARLHGSWARGVQAFTRGEDELEEFLIERIRAHGGECRLDRRAASIVVTRGAASGILEDGEEEPTGADCILSDQSGEAVADLAGGAGVTKSARRQWPRLSVAARRFVTSLVVRSAGLPEPLGSEAFILPKEMGRPDPRRPTLHVQKLSPSDFPDAPPEASGETLLVAEALLPKRGPLTLLEVRDAILGMLREHLPFIDEHLVVVDSPHDGLPLYDFSSGVRREIDRMHLSPGRSAGSEPLEPLWTVEPPGYIGLGAEPVRGPIPGTFLVGKTVLPALGQEGELLAAWGAARIITRKDRVRQHMRREMWNKIETG